jgi:formamidopyrimidine-DNA glycosylase
MPELPEVETTKRGIAPHIEGKKVSGVAIRQPQLRWPIPADLQTTLAGRKIKSVERRAKYLLIKFNHGTLIIHLGMSGSLRIVPRGEEPAKHDHFDLILAKSCLRLRDPRRFGAVLWTSSDPLEHKLLNHLGPEPLSPGFNGKQLHKLAQKRKAPVKSFIMDGKVVVGAGNIYANEALFMSRIHPRRPCNQVSLEEYKTLASHIKKVLKAAIKQGGTTLQDFQQSDGNPGYFAQKLQVYGKEGEPCPCCGRSISKEQIGQRSAFFCGQCQS